MSVRSVDDDDGAAADDRDCLGTGLWIHSVDHFLHHWTRTIAGRETFYQISLERYQTTYLETTESSVRKSPDSAGERQSTRPIAE